MSATLAVRHNVGDYATWRKVYDELEPLRAQHGCTAARVMRMPEDGHDLFITHEFPTAEQAGSFAHDPALRAGMQAGESRELRGSRSSRNLNQASERGRGRGAALPRPRSASSR